MSDLRKLLDEATPGPWEAALEPKCHGVVASINGQARFVALIGNDTDTPEREPMRFANASMIAMAPDLAAALLEAEEALTNVMGHVDTPISRRRLRIDQDRPEWLIVARDTLTEIRKLTGAK